MTIEERTELIRRRMITAISSAIRTPAKSPGS